MTHVFISYSHKDAEYIERLSVAIEGKGFTVWFDRDIGYGERWFPTIAQAIRDSAAVVVVMTPVAESSEWVEKEVLLALDHSKPIFPLLLDGKCFNLLINYQYVELKKHLDYVPPPRFYDQLQRVVPRRRILTDDELEAIARERAHPPSSPSIFADEEVDTTPPNPSMYSNITKWAGEVKNDPNNFYNLAMLAFAYEAEGSPTSHTDAIKYLKKALKLEPRIKNKKWIEVHFEWTEEHDYLLEKILTDPDFEPGLWKQ